MDETLSGVGFLSLVENIFLFIILQRCKRLPLQIKLLMLSSTVSDSILGADCFLLHCRALTDIFVNKEMFCWIRQSIFWTTVIVSVFFMTLLSLDRCLSLTLVMRYQSKIDLFTTSIVLIVAWSLGLVFGVSRAADVSTMVSVLRQTAFQHTSCTLVCLSSASASFWCPFLSFIAF